MNAYLRLRVPGGSLIPLTKADEGKLSSLLTRPYLTHQPNWKNEVSEWGRDVNLLNLVGNKNVMWFDPCVCVCVYV